MPLKNPFRIGVNHEAVMSARVKQQAVRRLRPDTVDRQQPLAYNGSFTGKQPAQIAAEPLNEHTQKRAQPPRLDVEITGRTDQFRQFRFRQREQFSRFEHLRRLQIGDGALDV